MIDPALIHWVATNVSVRRLFVYPMLGVIAFAVLVAFSSSAKAGSDPFGYDKYQHFLMGNAAAITVRAYAPLHWTAQYTYWAGCAAAAGVGILKEVHDDGQPHNRFDPLDAAWTAAGCLLTFEVEF